MRRFCSLSLFYTTSRAVEALYNKVPTFHSISPRSRELFSSIASSQSSHPINVPHCTEAGQSKMDDIPDDMTEDQKYLFDLNGYIVVRGVLTEEEVQEANAAIDNHLDEAIERSDEELRNASPDSPLYGTGPGRQDLGRVMEWGKAESHVFKSILAHPRLVPFFHGILGKGYRMDHLPFVIRQIKGSEGFSLHGGTIDCSSGHYNPHLAYACLQNNIHCNLLGCNVMLSDHNAGDGGFCVVPGSHKSNFKMPSAMVEGNEAYAEFIQQPVTKAGDVVLFSEGTVHGAKAWTSEDRERRACLYRFAPCNVAYGRSYFGHEEGGWPSAMYDDLNDAQRAVLEAPYANRLDRPNIIQPDCEKVEITTRSNRKKVHDQQVFGTKYF
mmetsp:Transcript_12464/g.19209  ORF Transcript_12464/g.19209 Transcript_12464/m.19209 type:complete len:382 (-) Transcript_12464:43-1188(-)